MRLCFVNPSLTGNILSSIGIPKADSTMNKMLLAVALVASIAMTGADVRECNDDVLNAIESVRPESGKIAAKLTNPDIIIQLKKQGGKEAEGFVMLPIPSLSEVKEQDICEKSLGITLGDNAFNVCGLSSFGFGQEENENGEDFVQAVLLFEPKMFETTLLVVELLVIPSEYEADAQKLKTWAAEKKVGIIPPVSVEQLNAIEEDKPITLDLEWLKELLGYGLFENEEIQAMKSMADVDIETSQPVVLDDQKKVPQGIFPGFFYHSRPIAVSKDFLNKLTHTIDLLKFQLES